jgi:hypothetical protein
MTPARRCSCELPGEATGSIALESAIDEAAWACGMDPLTFRAPAHPGALPSAAASTALRAAIPPWNGLAGVPNWPLAEAFLPPNLMTMIMRRPAGRRLLPQTRSVPP